MATLALLCQSDPPTVGKPSGPMLYIRQHALINILAFVVSLSVTLEAVLGLGASTVVILLMVLEVIVVMMLVVLQQCKLVSFIFSDARFGKSPASVSSGGDDGRDGRFGTTVDDHTRMPWITPRDRWSNFCNTN